MVFNSVPFFDSDRKTMNLIFRMLRVLIASFFKPKLTADTLHSSLSMRVLPNDLDLNMHMNNGRYLTICDLSRVDIFIRSGLAKTMLKQKWQPVIAEHTMTYKRPLNLFQKYQVSAEVTHWDEKYFYLTHTFESQGRIVAQGTSKGCVISKKGVISPVLAVSTASSRLKFNKL